MQLLALLSRAESFMGAQQWERTEQSLFQSLGKEDMECYHRKAAFQMFNKNRALDQQILNHRMLQTKKLSVYLKFSMSCDPLLTQPHAARVSGLVVC